jgi:DNA-binding LytR/AlgR family response regulator
MKPYDKPTLITAIKIAHSKFQEAKTQEPENPKREQNFLTVYKGMAMTKVPFADILYIESDGNYVNCNTIDNVYIKRASIKSLLELLPTSNFIRIDQGTIVNLDHVKELLEDRAVLVNDVKLHVSRSNKKALKKAFSNRL